MPIQIWTQDRVPELSFAGAQSLAGGIAGAGQSIGSAIERYQEKKKQEQDELKRVLAADKASMALIGALSDDERAQLGVPDKLSLSALAAGEPTALVTGAFKGLGVKQQVQSLQDALDQRRTREAAAQREAAFSRELAPLLEGGQSPESVPAPFSNEQFDRRTQPLDLRAVLAAASRTGNALNPNVDNLMSVLSRAQEGTGAEGLSFEEDPVSGMRFGRMGKQLLPSGMNPAKAAATPDTITDEDGNTFTVLRNPRTGAITQLRRADTGSVRPVDRYRALSAELKSFAELPPALLDAPAKERMAQIRAEMKALESGGKGTPAPAAAPVYPTATNPKTGEKLIFKDGQWQKP